MRVVLYGILCLLLVSLPAAGQGKPSLALFNLTPVSIDAIGLDGDLLFSMRKELERAQTFQLMSRRQMEEGLYRIDGAQVSDTSSVIEYGMGLGVSFVLTGNIDIQRSTIIVQFKLIDVVNGVEASAWNETFRTRAELVNRAPEVVSSLQRRIRKASEIKYDSGTAATALASFAAEPSGSAIKLTWKASDIGPVFYYNLYRGESESGPFEFVESTTETTFIDNKVPASGSYYYRLDIILETGDEMDGGLIAQSSVQKIQASRDVSPPSILAHNVFVNGVDIAFVPSISNKDTPIGYQLHFRKPGGNWQKAVKVDATNQINYKLSYVNELEPDTTYEFAISTIVEGDKESPLSPPVTVTTAPVLQLASDDTLYTRKVGLQWQPVADEYSVRVYRRLTPEDNWLPVGELSAGHGGRYYDTKNLNDGVKYEYAITLFDTFSESSLSNVVSKVTKKLPAPENVTATGDVKSVVLEWEPIKDDDVVGYRIYRAEGEINQQSMLEELVDVTGANSSRFIDGVDNSSPLQDGARYNYLVVALNTFKGTGFVSQTLTAETKPRPQNAGVIDVAIQGNEIFVQWEASATADIKTYYLSRQWNSEPWKVIAAVDGTKTQYLDSDVKPYAKTTYRIVAEDVDGLKSDPNQSATVTSPDIITLEVIKDGMLRKTSLKWSAHNNINGYKLYRRQAGTASWTLVETLTTPSLTEFTDNDRKQLKDGVTYEYAIRAYDQSGDTPMSNVVEASTKPAPAAPGNISAVSGLVKKVEISWTPHSDPDVKGYNVYRLDGNKRELLDTLKRRETARYEDAGSFFKSLKDGVEYRYQVSALNQYDAEGDISEVVSASTKPVPAQVSGFTATESVPNIVLDWNANPESDIDFYQIYRGTSCSNVRKLAQTKGTNFVDSDVSGGRDYCYRVSAVDVDELEGEQSGVSQVNTAPRAEGE